MPRYIDADRLINGIRQAVCTTCAIDYNKEKCICDTGDCIRYIEDCPTADVQEVKHGYWIDKGVLENYPRPDINVYHLLCCSECGALHRVRPYCEGGWINASYCPNCGAKMDGDNNGKDNSC